MDIEFNFKGDPVGGIISTCKHMKILKAFIKYFFIIFF